MSRPEHDVAFKKGQLGCHQGPVLSDADRSYGVAVCLT